MDTHEIQEKIAAQAEYCRERRIPHFAPDDGGCWACGRQIYEEITLKQASETHITGCPICCRSYCD